MTPDAEPENLETPAAPQQDMAPLAWVIDEIRTSLNEATAAIKTFLGNKSNTDSLRSAREHVHQVSGALQLLELRGVNVVMNSVEQLLERWDSEPDQCLPAAVRGVDATLNAVRNFLEALLAGQPLPATRLFPYYREILVQLQAQRIHPADLLFPDLARRPAFHRMDVHALSADELRIRRVHYEEGLLHFLRDPLDAQARGKMRDAIIELEQLPQRGLARTFWWVARALFDALDAFKLPVDADLKRFLARLNQQLRRQIEGGPVVAERLMIDALYHVGRADPAVERVAQVRQLYGLGALLPEDFERATLTTIDTEALTSLREALAQCKLLWGQLLASNSPDVTRFRAEVVRAQSSALRLGAPAPARVLGCIGEATANLASMPLEVRDPLGMEVATALLLLETGVDTNLPADPQFGQHADAMIERIRRVAGGQQLPEADPRIADLARRAQERSSIDTVVFEVRNQLREVELQLDRFFRDPSQRGGLGALDALFEQIGGVLGVLGHEDPAAALVQARASVARFANPATPADAREFARIAQILGAIGFFVGTLTQDATHPRGMFRYDPKTGVFHANMGLPAVTRGPAQPEDEEALQAAPEAVQHIPMHAIVAPANENVEASIARLRAEAHAQSVRLAAHPGDREAIDRLTTILAQLGNDAEVTDDAALRVRVVQAVSLLEGLKRDGNGAQALRTLLAPAVAEIPAPTAPMPASALAADRELHEIFVEEADEVLESIGMQLLRLRRDPSDAPTITMTRRAFHTLKGSSRMVGLRDFGEFAWALEQCFNVWLAQERPANDDLINLAAASSDRMRDWIEALRADPGAFIDAEPLIHAAHVVRDGGHFELPYTLEAGEIADPNAPTIEVTAAPAPAGDAPYVESAESPGEETRQIGPLSISHGLYSVFLNESDECVRALAQEIGEWRYEPTHPVSASIARLAHTLAGIADTVGLVPVCAIADPLDALVQLLERQGSTGARAGLGMPQFDVLERAVERVRGMLHQFAAGVYPDEHALEAGAVRDLLAMARAQAESPSMEPAAPVATAMSAPAAPVAPAASTARPAPTPAQLPTVSPGSQPLSRIPEARLASRPTAPAPILQETPEPVALPVVQDEIDEQLLQVFSIEAQDLLPAIAKCLRALASNPNQRDTARDLMRYLHTIKGSARMAGAMRLGELVHEMETRIESAMQLVSVPAVVIEDLQSQYDQALALFDHLQHPGGAPAPAPASNMSQTLAGVSGMRAQISRPSAPASAPAIAPAPVSAPAPMPAPVAAAATHSLQISEAPAPGADASRAAGAAPFIRVRADVVDRLVDHAGEVAISRSKLESEVATLRSSVTDLTENIQRLRSQLREVELQADAQIQARSDQVAKQSSTFDPLEFDRYSRLQELTRLLAESVEDVALVQSNMVKGLQLADNDLSSQSRLTRELQQQLMRVRLVPFANVSERLYRVARQAAKELGKRVRLDIVGAETEIDRSLLEQMAGPFEHLVRNAIVHGLEMPSERLAAGKTDSGELRIDVRKENNEIVVSFADDGAGLDLERIRARAVSAGLIVPDRRVEEREIIDLIFAPGLSTAHEVTELAGRGVGMDVVREQVSSLGGRISVGTERGRGSRFTLYLPMTLSIIQVVLASIGDRRYALPAAMVEQARRIRGRELAAALQAGSISFAGIDEVTLRPLAQLLGTETNIDPEEQYSIALLHLGDDRLAVCVEDLSANQEVVVKGVGPQVARMAGILGATVLGNGQVVLIINPVQLIARAPEPPEVEDAGADLGVVQPAPASPGHATRVSTVTGAMVLVVDDSLTVRRVTQRLLERNGYRALLAKDGVDAMRELQQHHPDVMLVDIEMPRMDGYDFTRNVRASSATRDIPIIMITSRTAEKHRRLAFELGVNEYLGKPYREDELLDLVRRYVETSRAKRAAVPAAE